MAGLKLGESGAQVPSCRSAPVANSTLTLQNLPRLQRRARVRQASFPSLPKRCPVPGSRQQSLSGGTGMHRCTPL